MIKGFNIGGNIEKVDYESLENLPDLSNKADLDENGRIPPSQLPSYVDDVLEYEGISNFPTNGESGKIYVDTKTNLSYRWGGSTYVEIGQSLALGETSSTAYRGDRGKIAYEHSQTPHDYAPTEHTHYNMFEVIAESGNSITLSNSANAPFANIRLYGHTEQNGTPTPDAPIPLVSVGDSGSFEVNLFGKNLLEITTTTQTINGVTFTVNADKSITASGTASATTQFRFVDVPFIPKGEYIISGYPQKVGSVEYYFRATGEGWEQAIGEVKRTYIEDVSAYGMIVIGANATVNNLTFYPMLRLATITDNTYEPCNKQTLTMPYTLPSVADIQEEIDFAKGVRFNKVGIYKSLISNVDITANGGGLFSIGGISNFKTLAKISCNMFVVGDTKTTNNTINTDRGTKKQPYFKCDGFETVESFKSVYGDKEIVIHYELETPIETPLTETELNAYRQLHTNKGTTTILSEAEMQVDYVVDSMASDYLEERFNNIDVSSIGPVKSIKSITTDDTNSVIVTFTDDTVQNLGQLNVNVQADFLTTNGFGNLRFTNNKFQYYDVTTSQWVDTQMTSENVTILNLTPQPMQLFSANYNPDTENVELYINESADTIIGGQTASTVEKVIIRRKKDGFPIDENDGDLILITERKNFGAYKRVPYIDNIDGLEMGDTYYYKAFPVNNIGLVGYSASNETQFTAKDYWLFGFVLDQNESDPASMIRYIEDNENYQSAYMDYDADSFNYGNWENAWFMKVKPCMLNYDGTVAYYLNLKDYNLKEDGTASDITNDSFGGNAMVGIPKTYWKIIDNGDDTANIYFSNKKVDDDFVCWSHIDNNGNEIDYCYIPIYNGYSDGTRLRSLSNKTPMHSKTPTVEIDLAKANNQDGNIIWYTEVYSDRLLINLLLLLIGKSTNSQIVFGNGYYTGGSTASNPRIATGTMDNKGLFWGDNGSSNVGVKVFGIEHWWGNQWRRVAGWINVKGAQKIKLTYGQYDGSSIDGYNIDGSGYNATEYTSIATCSGYTNKMAFTNYGLLPILVNGSATTYYTDSGLYNSSVTGYLVCGGSCKNGFSVGTLAYALDSGNNSSGWNFGTSISCKPLAPIEEVE